MRYELSDFERAAIRPMQPNKPERRVRWREGNPVTCFACKRLRRNERTKLKPRSAARLISHPATP